MTGHKESLRCINEILVPVDLADPNLAKPALETAVMMAKATDGDIQLDQRAAGDAGDAGRICAAGFRRAAAQDRPRKRSSIIARRIATRRRARVTSAVRQGGTYQEILEEARSSTPT